MAKFDFNEMKQVIVDKLGVKPEDVKMEASFANDLGADSLDIVELVMELESKYEITIPDDMAQKLQTVGDAAKFVEAKLAEKK